MGELSSDFEDFMLTKDWGVEPIDVMPRQPLKAKRICIEAGTVTYYLWEVECGNNSERLTDGEFVQAYQEVPKTWRKSRRKP